MTATPPNEESHVDMLIRCLNHMDAEAARHTVSVKTEELIRSTGRGLILTQANLTNRDLQGFDLRRANLNRAQLYGTNLSSADLSECSLICPGMERTTLIGTNLSGSYLHALGAQNCNFREADLSAVIDATGSLFHGCSMVDVKMDGAILSGSTFYQCDLSRSSLKETNLQGSVFNECFLDEVIFFGSLVSQLTITKCHMQRSDLTGVVGKGLTLQRLTSSDELQLTHANVPGLSLDTLLGNNIHANHLSAPHANIKNCNLTNAHLLSADLRFSSWNDCNLEKIILRGAKLEGSTFNSCSMVSADMSGVLAENIKILESKLTNATMTGFAGRCATFRDCDLSDSDMSASYLYRAMLTGDPPMSMSMCRVNLQGANLVQAYVAADLSSANLRGANCVYGRLNQAVLRNADLSGVNFYQASLIKTDFTGAKAIGLKPPFFADRCPGLRDAVDGGHDGDLSQYLEDLQQLLRKVGASST